VDANNQPHDIANKGDLNRPAKSMLFE
jgi:hypothetical protein